MLKIRKYNYNVRYYFFIVSALKSIEINILKTIAKNNGYTVSIIAKLIHKNESS